MKNKFKKYILLLIFAILAGVPASLISYLFLFIIDKISLDTIQYLSNSILIIITPAVGGLLVGILLHYGTLTAKGHGVPLLLSTIKSEKTGLTKSDLEYEGLATTITVISGGSVGLIGPIIELTTGITDIFGRLIKLELKEYQTLIGCGAAASFAAVFQAPFAGIIFSLEVINKNWSIKNIFYTTVSAFSSYYLFNLIKPEYDYFLNFSLSIRSLTYNQYIFIIVFSFIISLIGWIFYKTLLLSDQWFSNLDIPLYYKPAIGGLVVGLIGYFYLQIMGTGSNLIFNINSYQAPIKIIFILVILKIIVTCLTIGSGGSGGLFGPIIFIGLLSGLLIANLGVILTPSYVITPMFLAICGVVGIFSGLIKAPITSIILILEFFYIPDLIIPLILVSFIPYILLNLSNVKSIFSPDLMDQHL
ncbi:MAG: chloride channel protein [Halanaerobiales bacterium]|nr:chloride channel protein [Halanaerobiales bacterium]